MRFGFSVHTFDDLDARALALLAREAEEAGWDGFVVWDHVLWDPLEAGMTDTTVALAAIALATERIRFGPLVAPLARRRPWKFARETVSLDRLSAGRLVVGVGSGWDPDFPPVGETPSAEERAERLDEALAVVTRLWKAQPVTFRGRFHRVEGAVVRPSPVQRPRPPIWVGGWWPNRAPARRAARWDGIVPLNRGESGRPLSPDAAGACVEYVRRHRGHERPLDVVVTAFEEPPKPYAAAGATWWLSGVGVDESSDDSRARVHMGPHR